MAKKYKQIKRNGRWVTINVETGKVVNPGQGQLGDLASRAKQELNKFGDNLVYSDKTDNKGRPLTRAQARDGQNADGSIKVGAKRTRNGKVEIYDGDNWVAKSKLESQANRGGRGGEFTPRNNTRSKDSKGDTYTVGGITYSRKTGRPIKVPENRQPVQAEDRTKKDPPKTTTSTPPRTSPPRSTPPRTTSSSSSSSSSSSTPPRRKPTGQGSQGFRKGDKDLGAATGITASGSKPAKPKSRLEQALSGIGKWKEPEKTEKRNKPTSRFLKKTDNTRRR